jgi:hypothetical protein
MLWDAFHLWKDSWGIVILIQPAFLYSWCVKGLWHSHYVVMQCVYLARQTWISALMIQIHKRYNRVIFFLLMLCMVYLVLIWCCLLRYPRIKCRFYTLYYIIVNYYPTLVKIQRTRNKGIAIELCHGKVFKAREPQYMTTRFLVRKNQPC